MQKEMNPAPGCWQKVVWFVGLWLAGLVGMSCMAGLIKLGMHFLKTTN